MPGDERSRRRLGDETKAKIADLASGWTLDGHPDPEPDVAPVAPPGPPPAAPLPARVKPRTLPPPPPGSSARAALEAAVVDAPATPAPARAKPRSTAPPPIPPPGPPRRAMPAAPPGASPQAALATERPTEPDLERPTIRDLSPARPAAAPAPVVPRGEFDDRSTSVEEDKLRIAHAQATIKRDAASALLGIPEPPLTTVQPTPVEVLLTESAARLRDDPTSLDPATVKFERGDPTQLGGPDPTDADSAPPIRRERVGRLRTVATLRRQRGVLGDVRYIVTATRGMRAARRELEALTAQQALRQQERRKCMVVLGRTAVTSDAFDHSALGPAREQLAGVEDERARHHGQVVAADQELERVKRDRDRHAKQYATDIAAVDLELSELARRIEPLHKEQTAATRRAAELRDSLRRIDAQIAQTTASLVSVKGQRQDPAAIQAEIATLKADRLAVQRDEPRLAAQLDALSPRIAALEAQRAEAQKRRAELARAEDDDRRRTEELLAAIGAKRKVMDRAASDAEVLRDKILFELGERLYVDRPEALAAQLAPIDAIDLELGTGDRRAMELKEILGSLDRAKLARGILVVLLAVVALGGFTAWVLYMVG